MVRHQLIHDDLRLPDSVRMVRSLFDVPADGRVFDRDELIADATRNLELFGYFGLSLWAVAGEAQDSEITRMQDSEITRIEIEFVSMATDKVLGTAIRDADGKISTTGLADQVISTEADLQKYGSWSNGYVLSRTVLSIVRGRGEWTLDRALAERLSRAARVALFTAGSLRAQGLGIVLGSQAPRVDVTAGRVPGSAKGPVQSIILAGRVARVDVTVGQVPWSARGRVQITAASAEDLAGRFLRAAYAVVENYHFVGERD